MTTSDQKERWVDVRKVWEHEALDFTPWLTQNLNLLGQELGLKLEFVTREKPVGPFFLDILAKETDTQARVAIENQLEWTDFSHLGQLLTYATGCGAQVAIWIAPEFRYEHAEALHRLNQWTVDGIRFYGVKVEAALMTGNSDPEPRFRKVVYPGGWNKQNTLQPGPSESPDSRQHQEFFGPLIAELSRTGFSRKGPTQIYGHTGRYFPSSRNQGIWYAATLEGLNDAWVTLHIQTGDKELTKRIFDTLHAGRRQVESAITANPVPEWHWRRHDRWTFSSINIRRDGSITDPPEKQDDTRVWMLDLLPKLKEVFDPRVTEILGNAPVGR